MTTDHSRSAESIFHEARSIRSDAEREAFLARCCAGDVGLRAKIAALLAADENAGDFLATADMPYSDELDISGTMVGPYKLLQRIGEGGFGTVYMAEQCEPVRRKVALKVIKPGMDSKQVIGRFEAERQALAMMDHPNIARVFDGGLTAAGRPYFVMEYVVGDEITKFADAHKLTVDERLHLFRQVCLAVQHAHQKGVIHRDLKPANILVSMVDGKSFAKVIDFGIAKATGASGGRLTDKTIFTEHRQLIGTPEYMSPEQAGGSPDIDTRTDVYALGVLLYELLTGVTPFDAKRLRSAMIDEMRRIIREEEPPAPSLRLTRDLDTNASTAAMRRVEPGRLSAQVKGELDWIVMKALDKDRARRYESASGLAGDVERHLAGEAITAAPPSAAYRLRKFVRRNKGPVIAGGLVAAVLLMGIAGTAWGWRHALLEANRARLSEADVRWERFLSDYWHYLGKINSDEHPDYEQLLVTLNEIASTRSELLGADHLLTIKTRWIIADAQRWPHWKEYDSHGVPPEWEEMARQLESAGTQPDGQIADWYVDAFLWALDDFDIDSAMRWAKRTAPLVALADSVSESRVLPWWASRLTAWSVSESLEDYDLCENGNDRATPPEEISECLMGLTRMRAIYASVSRVNPERSYDRGRRIIDVVTSELSTSPDDPLLLTALAVGYWHLEKFAASLDAANRAAVARERLGLEESWVNTAIAAIANFKIGNVERAQAQAAHLKEMWDRFGDRRMPSRFAFRAEALELIEPAPKHNEQAVREN